MEINQLILRDMFDYREDGNLIRKDTGSIVGSKPKVATRNRRYAATKIKGQHFCVHKLIYMYHYGEMPKQLDHINKDSLDNRIENLRLATSSENMSNRNIFKNNKSGYPGVCWHKQHQKWGVTIGINGKFNHLGYFEDLELAGLVSIEARDKYHGKYASLAHKGI